MKTLCEYVADESSVTCRCELCSYLIAFVPIGIIFLFMYDRTIISLIETLSITCVVEC